MRFDLPEMAEDAIAGYIRAGISSDINVYEAFSSDAPRFPCIVVLAAVSSPISEDSEYSAQREMSISVTAMINAGTEVDDDTTSTKTSRQRKREMRQTLAELLCIPDLVSPVNEMNQDINFSQLIYAGDEQSAEDRRIAITFNLFAIANPVED